MILCPIFCNLLKVHYRLSHSHHIFKYALHILPFPYLCYLLIYATSWNIPWNISLSHHFKINMHHVILHYILFVIHACPHAVIHHRKSLPQQYRTMYLPYTSRYILYHCLSHRNNTFCLCSLSTVSSGNQKS